MVLLPIEDELFFDDFTFGISLPYSLVHSLAVFGYRFVPRHDLFAILHARHVPLTGGDSTFSFESSFLDGIQEFIYSTLCRKNNFLSIG